MATEKRCNLAEFKQGLSYSFQRIIKFIIELIGTHDELMQKFPMQQANSDSIVNKIDFIKNDPALKINEKGDIAYFMGCSSQMESIFYQFDIKYKDTPRAVISILNDAGITPVVLETKCCGHDSYWSGYVETAKKLAIINVDLYQKAGVKTIIVECAEGYRMWKYDYPGTC
jgi:Fe-S oxidoreductase